MLRKLCNYIVFPIRSLSLSLSLPFFHLIQANSTDSLVPNVGWPRTPFRTPNLKHSVQTSLFHTPNAPNFTTLFEHSHEISIPMTITYKTPPLLLSPLVSINFYHLHISRLISITDFPKFNIFFSLTVGKNNLLEDEKIDRKRSII